MPLLLSFLKKVKFNTLARLPKEQWCTREGSESVPNTAARLAMQPEETLSAPAGDEGDHPESRGESDTAGFQRALPLHISDLFP